MKIQVGKREWSCLHDGRFLNDVVINMFVQHIQHTTDKIILYSTTLYDYIQDPAANTKQWLEQDHSKLWVFPACEENHWALVTVNHQTKKITQLDTYYRTTRCARKMKKYLESLNYTNYKTIRDYIFSMNIRGLRGVGITNL